MRAAIATEWLKLRRSKVTWTISSLVLFVLPAMSYGLFWVATNGGFGPLAAKTSGLIVGEGWEGYLSAAGQIAAVAGFLAASVCVTWVFGREFTEVTFPSLFALPVPRSSIAIAKFAVTALWAVGVVVGMVLVFAILGISTSVGSYSTSELLTGLGRLLVIGLLASGLGLTSAPIATWGRGFLPAIGAMILVVAIAQMAVLFGTGGWFPYAVPGLMAAAGTEGVPSVTSGQVGLVGLVVAVSVWLTARAWQRAEAV